jgi:hypothetical protein
MLPTTLRPVSPQRRDSVNFGASAAIASLFEERRAFPQASAVEANRRLLDLANKVQETRDRTTLLRVVNG